MSDITKEKIQENYLEALKDIAYSSGVSLDTVNNNIVKAIDPYLTFSELDSFYFDGITDLSLKLAMNFNLYQTAYDVYSLLIGKKMFLTYEIDYDDYVKWAGKQEGAYKYGLFLIIGKRVEEDREESKKAIDKEKNELYYGRINTYFSKLSFEWIKEDPEGDICLLDKKFSLDNNTKKTLLLLQSFDKCKDFGIKFFKNEFKTKCSTSSDCVNNLGDIIEESHIAFWSRYKRVIIEIGYEDKISNLTREIKCSPCQGHF